MIRNWRIQPVFTNYKNTAIIKGREIRSSEISIPHMIQVCRKEESMSEQNFGQELLHTPGGVRDIYGAECASRLKIQQELHQVMISYGFRDIQTPTFEYFDIFSKEKGSVQSQAMFKFFDRGNNTLVLRPDITPAIARCVSKYDREEEMPIRLCYMGNTFVNTTPYKGKLQEVTQLGAELFNDTSSDADAEMVVLTIECLLKSGLQEFQLEIGHADLLRGLVEEAGFSAAEAEELFTLIESKNFFGVEEFVDSLSMNDKLRKLFGLLDNFDLQDEQLMEALKLAKGYDEILSSIDTLLKLREYLKAYGIEKYISYELGLISDYTYYTGIIFQGYTYGTGEPIVKGGRYDKLLSHFGKDAAAIGFAIVVDQLMAALSRQDIDVPVIENSSLIVFEEAAYHAAIKRSMELRRDGVNTQMVLKDKNKTKEDYASYAVDNRINRVEFIEE